MSELAMGINNLFGSGNQPGSFSGIGGNIMTGLGSFIGNGSPTGNIASSLVQGAGAGMVSGGPVGMALGAAGGLLKGIVGNISERSQEKKAKQAYIENMSDQYHNRLKQMDASARVTSKSIIDNFPTRGVQSPYMYSTGGPIPKKNATTNTISPLDFLYPGASNRFSQGAYPGNHFAGKAPGAGIVTPPIANYSPAQQQEQRSPQNSMGISARDLFKGIKKLSPNIDRAYAMDVANHALTYGSQYNIDPKFLIAQMFQESSFQKDALSHAGARGIAQFMPAAAKHYNVDVNDIESSIRGMAHYMRDNVDSNIEEGYGADLKYAAMRYNAGGGNFRKIMKGEKYLKETANYYDKYIKKHYQKAFNSSQENNKITLKGPVYRKKNQPLMPFGFVPDAPKLSTLSDGGYTTPMYEVEKGEVVQGHNIALQEGTPLSSDLVAVGGQRHENGGTKGVGGERVFSDRLFVDSTTYQKLKVL